MTTQKSISTYRWMARLSLLAVALGWASLTAARAANTWYVATTGTDAAGCGTAANPCKTIQYAISNVAASGDTVDIASGTYTENLSINLGLWLVGSKVIVDGGSNRMPVAVIGSGARVQMVGLTLQHGQSYSCGGGILNSGSLLLVVSTVTANQAILTDSSPGLGGGICNGGVLQLLGSTVSGNTAGEGGGICNLGQAYIWGSTLSGNSTSSFGGAVENFGTLDFADSTLANNSAVYGAGIDNSGTVTVNSSTISGNKGFYAGINNEASYTTVTLTDTILAGNGSMDCGGTITSQDYNLVGNTSGCSFAAQAHDLLNVAADLGPLQNNGGPTQTMALMSGSPAVDAGNPNGCPAPNGKVLATDQRGYPRGQPCDIGAFELQ